MQSSERRIQFWTIDIAPANTSSEPSNTANMPNWKSYESSVRLLSAIVAAHPGMKLNYDGTCKFHRSSFEPPHCFSFVLHYI
jgi:hypothetical protein